MNTWLEQYQLFLFDLDGLLVNTEHLHKLAYERLANQYGRELKWDFATFCSVAHVGGTAIRDYFYSEFQDLVEEYPDWAPLYEQKCALYEGILSSGQAELMPGAEALLKQLLEKKIRHAVVTHSRAKQVAMLRDQLPVLGAIPNWITREDYSRAKPDPEGYEVAMQRLGVGKAVGFEDTPRGVKALLGTKAQAVLVCPPDYPLLQETLNERVIHIQSLEELLPVHIDSM